MKNSTLQPETARSHDLARRPRTGRKLTLAALALGTLCVGASPALATIVAVAPSFILFTPSDVSLDQTESDVDIFAFDERQCVLLQKDLETDERVIPKGNRVRCHLAHMDPVNPGQVLEGRARFDTPIIGVISSSALLDASDGPCGLPGVVYPAPGSEPNRGLEAFQPNDQYQVSPNQHAIRARMDVPAFSDELRVITSCCPQTGCPAEGGFPD